MRPMEIETRNRRYQTTITISQITSGGRDSRNDRVIPIQCFKFGDKLIDRFYIPKLRNRNDSAYLNALKLPCSCQIVFDQDFIISEINGYVFGFAYDDSTCSSLEELPTLTLLLSFGNGSEMKHVIDLDESNQKYLRAFLESVNSNSPNDFLPTMVSALKKLNNTRQY